MPLMESLYKIIYQNKKPESLLDDLINHPHEIDVEFTQRGN
jgi:glycerol-3-phosphate dehydrogenase